MGGPAYVEVARAGSASRRRRSGLEVACRRRDVARAGPAWRQRGDVAVAGRGGAAAGRRRTGGAARWRGPGGAALRRGGEEVE